MHLFAFNSFRALGRAILIDYALLEVFCVRANKSQPLLSLCVYVYKDQVLKAPHGLWKRPP